MKKNNYTPFYVAGAFVLWAILGCGGISPDDFDFDYTPSNTCGGDAPDVTGVWVIEGSGKRTDCSRESFDSDDLRVSSLSIPISYDADTETFEVGDGLPAGFELTNGSVNGSCISFNTEETAGDSDQSMLWEGKFSNDNTIEGEFTGNGPFRCQTSGEFRMTRQ